MRPISKTFFSRILLVFFFGNLSFLCPVPARASLFEEANTHYQKGNFKEAIEGYEKIGSSGRSSAAVYYNLGNAYFRTNQKGKALIAYERALRLAPRDRDILWNMNILKSTFPDRIAPADNGLTLFWAGKIADLFSMREIEVIFSAHLFLWMLISLIGFMFAGLKKQLKVVQSILLILLVLVSAVFVFKWYQVKDPKAVILVKEVYARYGPSDKETKAFLLHEGAEGKLIDETKSWRFISLANKNSGWVPKDSCGVI